MDIINEMFRLQDKYKEISIALGTFDGVHLGHRKIIQRVVESARLQKGTSVVFTFDPHPRMVLKPDMPLPMITTLAEKREIMAGLGVDVFFTLPFYSEFARLSPEEFVRNILVEYIRPELVVVGPNYTFGHRGEGTAETLRKLGRKFGFLVIIEAPVFTGGQMVSSTLIRKMINRGEIGEANKLLARYFTMSGQVVSGDRRGRELGFPTANVAFSTTALLPADGVYAVKVVLNGRRYSGVANIGANPTFKVGERRLEVHILDFSADIYEQFITVQFVQRIRNIKAFARVDELIGQIARDATSARNILTEHT